MSMRISFRSLFAAGLIAAALSAALSASPAAQAQAPTQAPAPAAAPGTTTALPTLNDPVAARREYELSLKLRCLVCQNQSIAESNAELAVDLRRQVREQVAAGKSDNEIVDFMTARYGDFVLYSPPLKGTTMLLWFGPALLVLIGLVVAWRVVRARKALPAQAPLSDAERERAAQLLLGKGEGNAK